VGMIKLLLLFFVSDQFTVTVATPTPVFTVTVQEKTVEVTKVTVKTKKRGWYLVSESWCINCPPAKDRFKAKGWPEANIITNAECKKRFGFSVPYVPYEFQEPEVAETAAEEVKARIQIQSSTEQAAESHLKNVHGISVSGLSLQEMEVIHDNAHGGPGYHFPGQPSLPTTQSNLCPTGQCPTYSTRRFRIFKR